MREKAILENETNQNPPKKQTRTSKTIPVVSYWN